ncbi:MAG TPA: TVP38/TMEM64 family protein [Thermoanaerobaculia bacterium]
MAARSSSKWTTIAVIGAVIVVGVAALLFLRSRGTHPQQIAQWLRDVGDRWWAPIAFVGLYTVFNVFLVPATILTLTAGVVWGWLIGGLWVLAASTVASALPYFVGRSGAGWAEELLERRAGRIHRALRNEGFISLLLMRLVPVVPYNVLNYAAGVAGIKVRDYLLATFIGTIPGIFIFTYLASSIASGLVSPRAAFVRILIAGGLLGALALASRLLAGRVRARLNT